MVIASIGHERVASNVTNRSMSKGACALAHRLRKALSFIATVSLVAAFVGCSGGGPDDNPLSESTPSAASMAETGDSSQPGATIGSGYSPVAGWSEIGLPDFVGEPHFLMVWTGNEILLWGDYPYDSDRDYPYDSERSERSSFGAAYDPETGDWRRLADIPGPARWGSASIWMGEELIVCCGRHSSSSLAYDPVSDAWRTLADVPTTSAFSADAVWTGAEMLVVNREGVTAYKPENDEWRAVVRPPARLGNLGTRREVAWTGAELIVWPAPISRSLHTGLAFDPEGNT